ncbi:MAG TPA: hypothetical protein VGO43_08605 [Pyrinomonadaceae bacterium]|nr:hypothetical protein [Pyrinomonadaceae bacterium]
MIKELSICVALASVIVGHGCVNRGNATLATPEPTPMNNSENGKTADFMKNLPAGFVQPTDGVGRRLLREYGAVFVARGGAQPPKMVVFQDEAAVTTYQSTLKTSKQTLGGITIELQEPAMTALLDASKEAGRSHLKITPRSADSARRGYKHTVDLWASRVNPGLAHWTAAGKVTAGDAKRIMALSPYEQVPEIFELEDKGIFFSKDFSKTIIYSVAPPGTSQHLSMLALDVAQFDDSRVRAILARHGWFQTVTSDLPHFTYLGIAESELPTLGLKKVVNADRDFWVPDL